VGLWGCEFLREALEAGMGSFNAKGAKGAETDGGILPRITRITRIGGGDGGRSPHDGFAERGLRQEAEVRRGDVNEFVICRLEVSLVIMD
jgi:hypothetical protein